jgi:hypothetical protein
MFNVQVLFTVELFPELVVERRGNDILFSTHSRLLVESLKSLASAKMAPTKKSSSVSKTRSSGSQISLQKVKGENFYRDAKQVKRLKMLSGGKAVRDRDGKIIQAAAFQKGEDETTPGRVQPDRRWFGASLSLSLCVSTSI